MTPAAIIREALADGVTVALSPAGTIKATGDGAAVYRWLPTIREHKPELLRLLATQTATAFRRWRIDGREATYSPPVTEAALRRWYPTAELEPIPDDRTPPTEATGADGVDRRAMAQAVRLALRGTGLDVEAVLSELTDDELADWRAGWFGPAEIVAFARSLTSRGTP